MNILDEDLSVFLGNAIDNALEASESVDCKSREIRIQMTFEKGISLYIIEKPISR